MFFEDLGRMMEFVAQQFVMAATSLEQMVDSLEEMACSQEELEPFEDSFPHIILSAAPSCTK